MQKPIGAAIGELLFCIRSAAILHAILDSVPVFLGIFLILVLVRTTWFVGLAIWIPYLAWKISRRLRAADLLAVESKTPSLNERLRTAGDTVHKSNVVVNALHYEVLQRLRHVWLSDFVGFNRITRQVLLSVLLAFGVLILAASNIYIFTPDDVVAQFNELRSLRSPKYYPGASYEVPPEPQNDSSIYGKKSLIELGTNELKLELTPLASDVDIRKAAAAEQKQFIEAAPPVIAATAEAGFDENIPKEHQQIVKAYFSQIVKG